MCVLVFVCVSLNVCVCQVERVCLRVFVSKYFSLNVCSHAYLCVCVCECVCVCLFVGIYVLVHACLLVCLSVCVGWVGRRGTAGGQRERMTDE